MAPWHVSPRPGAGTAAKRQGRGTASDSLGGSPPLALRACPRPRAGGLVAALLGLATMTGCVAVTPLPLSPLQVIVGGWPIKETAVRTVPRAYTIKGDTFAFPATGFSINRPNERDWEFQATGSGVGILLKQGVGGSEPRPSMTISIIPVPEGTDIPGALAQDQLTIFQAGGGVATQLIGVDGIQGESWIVTQPDPETKLTVRTWRVYLVHENTITLAQGRAEPNAFVELLPTFEQMLTTMRVPKSPNANKEGETGVKRIDLVRAEDWVMRDTLLQLKADPKTWLVTNNGVSVSVEARKLPQGAVVRPAITITAAQLQPGTDAAKLVAEEKAAIEKDGTKITTGTGTLDGKTGETWEYTVTPAGAEVGITRKRITVLEASSFAQVEYAADSKAFDSLKADLEAIVATIKLPPPAPAQAAAQPAQ